MRVKMQKKVIEAQEIDRLLEEKNNESRNKESLLQETDSA